VEEPVPLEEDPRIRQVYAQNALSFLLYFITKAEDAAASGDYDTAIQVLRHFIFIHPSNVKETIWERIDARMWEVEETYRQAKEELEAQQEDGLLTREEVEERDDYARQKKLYEVMLDEIGNVYGVGKILFYQTGRVKRVV